MESKQINYLIS